MEKCQQVGLFHPEICVHSKLGGGCLLFSGPHSSCLEGRQLDSFEGDMWTQYMSHSKFKKGRWKKITEHKCVVLSDDPAQNTLSEARLEVCLEEKSSPQSLFKSQTTSWLIWILGSRSEHTHERHYFSLILYRVNSLSRSFPPFFVLLISLSLKKG